MVTVEAADPHAVTPARFKPAGDSKNFIGLFDEVLSSVRQSTFRLADLADRRKAFPEQASPREQWVENARRQEGTDNNNSPRQKLDEQEPSRAERLSGKQQCREIQQAADNDSAGRRQEQVSPQKESRAERMNNLDQAEADIAKNESAGPQKESNPATVAAQNVAGSSSQNTTGTQPTSESQNGNQNAQPGAMGAFGQHIQSEQQQTAGNAANANAAQGQTPSGGIKISGGQSNGRQMQGQFLHLQQTAQSAGKNTEAGEQKGNSTLHFQNLLDGAGKARAHNQQVRLQAGRQSAGQNSTGQTVKLDEPGSIRELANVVRSRIGAKNSNMLLQLDPPELGKLRIDVQMRDGQFTVRLEAQTQAGHDALQSRLSDLRHNLEQQGIQLNQVEVDLKPPAPANDSANARMQDQEAGQQGGGFENTGGGTGRSPEDSMQFSSGHTQDNISLEAGQALEGEEQQPIAGPAETGVDLVI